MLIGHWGVGLGLKKILPQIPLWILCLASIWADFICSILIIFNIEELKPLGLSPNLPPFEFIHYPWSHSLLALCMWASIFALILRWKFKSQKTAFVVAIAVISHWLLDWIAHRPDVQLIPGGRGLGLGLWNSLSMTLIIELGIFFIGVYLYWSTQKFNQHANQRWIMGYLILLLSIYYLSIFGKQTLLNNQSMGLLGVGAIIILLWGAYKIDNQRRENS